MHTETAVTGEARERLREAAEAARHAAMDAVKATGDALVSTLDQMEAIEAMRKAMRDIKDINKPGSN